MQRGCITEREQRYFIYKYKNLITLGKLYLLSKIHKTLDNVARISVVSKCGVPAK